MGENRSLLTTLGAILGLVIFVFVIMQAFSYFREGKAEFDEMQRKAGAPILLSETLHESSDGAQEGVVEEAAAEETATGETATEEVAVAETTEMTATTALTETGAVTATEAVTTSEVAPAAEEATVDAGAEVTETASIEETPAITETESVSETAATAEETVAEEPAAEETDAEVALVAPSADEVAPIFTKAGCIGCHVIPEIPGAVGAVGPNLTGIGTIGATRVEGLNAQEYINQSILEPNAFIAPECPTGPCLPGLMVQNLGDILTAEEIDLVVAYLASQVEE